MNIQPKTVEIRSVDGIFVKTMHIELAGVAVPQHSHNYSHLSMVAKGSVRAWRDGLLLGDFKAPCGIEIPAFTKHTFVSLEPDTLILCIHNISRTGDVEIHAPHELEVV